MVDDFDTEDVQLSIDRIASIENRDGLTDLFAELGYDVDNPITQSLEQLGIDNEDAKREIQSVHRIAVDRETQDEIQIYLFEVRSTTVWLREVIARAFRTLPGNYILILTRSDFEELHFVLLERVLRKRKTGQSQVIRPRVLKVQRKKPSNIQLRTLKRFTFTEIDELEQWDKLLSAYEFAEWSEEYFNNRALFSDYYLKNRLADADVTPQWNEDIRPVGREVQKLISTIRKTLKEDETNQTLKERTLEHLTLPLLGLLGFDSVEVDITDATQPDYRLYHPDNNQDPLAIALTYPWNRNLDGPDLSEREDEDAREENPETLVVSLLQQAETPWVIMTNGKQWRLYSSTASNKATNYYEVDLEEAFAEYVIDRIDALRYWYFMFRREAFEGFLDDVLEGSSDYAKELGDRLKDRVFTRIFPYFAKGFIHDLRDRKIAEDDIRDGLPEIFSGTMTFLYRLMFILYAESLDLLPLQEDTGYRDISLYELKKRIADIGGTIRDDRDQQGATNQLDDHYGNKSTKLYDYLLNLSHVIDEGSQEHNLPTYNGGLFSATNTSGSFLEENKIPDRYLAIGLDYLTRDIDPKTQALVFIDFKSLGVRQLGSIYEGLLEFQLRIADERLAVIKDNKREIYMPYAEAEKQNKRIVETLEPDMVYLENTKQERKATGSYYTPDYIVKYIVEHTVGPVLERKFEELAPKLRDANSRYGKMLPNKQAKGEDPDTFWQLHEPRSEWSLLVDECLNIRVLDPAMGSGHFLVEVVDYVSRRLAEFLNGFTNNPVWASLEQTREDIVEEMTAQGVTINYDRLTRLALLKRAVLKRCVYGVDLNPMAVELAKVSLWLDAFTLGAPLSFLDHHLKCGNSLIGAFDISEYVAPGSVREQLIIEAAQEMVEVSKLVDATKAQVDETVLRYHEALAKLEDVKKFLNVPVGAYFVEEIQEYAKKKHSTAVAQIAQVAYGKRVDETWVDLFEKAQQKADNKCFFHWKLEFPEVFFELESTKSNNRDVSGFDAIVSNPPWGSDYDQLERAYFKDIFVPVHVRSPESFTYFSYQMWQQLHRYAGYAGIIIPNPMLHQYEYWRLRKLFSDDSKLVRIVNLGDGIFEDVTAPTCIIVFKIADSTDIEKYIDLRFVPRESLIQQVPKDIDSPFADDFRFTTEQYSIRLSSTANLIDKCYIWPQLSEIADEVATGVSSGLDEAFVYDQAQIKTEQLEHELMQKLVIGGEIDRFTLHARSGKQLLYVTSDTPIGDYPNALRVLERHKGQLIKRREAASGQISWYSLHWPRYKGLFETRKILIRQTSDRIRSVTDDSHWYCLKSVIIVTLTGETNESPEYIVAILNSQLIDFLYRDLVGEEERVFPEVKPVQLSKLPIRLIDFSGHIKLSEQNLQTIEELYSANNYRAILRLTQTDDPFIHDSIVFLVKKLLEANNQVRSEIDRFLYWLENTLRIIPKKDGSGGIDSLSGKTIIQNYLGDYQKGERQLPFSEFWYRLEKVKRRFGVNLADVRGAIEDAYEKSLDVLLPIKEQLAETDILIDQIVYKLYGLTDEEIELIERPQYEQALSEAKAKVLEDKKIEPGSDEAVERIAEGILPASELYFRRMPQHEIEARLQDELSGWEFLPDDVKVFLTTAEWTILQQPDGSDFSTSMISYGKAVEGTLTAWVFARFAEETGATSDDVRNPHFKNYLDGKGYLSLSLMKDVLRSKKEKTFRAYILRVFPNAESTLFSDDAMLAYLTNENIQRFRNDSAHDTVMSREDAEEARTWALTILSYL